jgi:hypothetical protein
LGGDSRGEIIRAAGRSQKYLKVRPGAKDEEGAANQYAATVPFDKTLQGRITP